LQLLELRREDGKAGLHQAADSYREMIASVALAKIYGPTRVNHALATAADLQRFADEDLAQLLRHQATAANGELCRMDGCQR
jgi:hypothetical protein